MLFTIYIRKKRILLRLFSYEKWFIIVKFNYFKLFAYSVRNAIKYSSSLPLSFFFLLYEVVLRFCKKIRG
jgi:hypothetical protein